MPLLGGINFTTRENSKIRPLLVLRVSRVKTKLKKEKEKKEFT